jgi:multidrug efflux pump subunit AcrA (membrane-fusion protein)
LTHTITRGDLLVTVTERGTIESSDNTEIKCKVRGQNTVIWVIESGSLVQPGDDLVRLDTLFIEEQINERSKYAHWSRSGAEYWRASVAKAELAIPEYLEGRYVAQMMTLEKDLAVAESNLSTAQNMLDHAQRMYDRGYRSELVVDEKKFAVKRSRLEVEVTKTRIDVLRDYSKAMEVETLTGNLKAARAEFAGNDERAFADAARRDRAVNELEHCVVKAKRAGMVIYPSAAAWENVPDIEEGATVHKEQVLLLMPDLSKMQVKFGIHESIIDRIKAGLPARVTFRDQRLEAEVSSVSSIARPAGWWTGNVVKYDTIIELPPVDGLKPGMSAEVEVIVARHEDVLTVPVAAVLETEEGDFCWVQTSDGPERRSLRLGDTNDTFIVVETGLKEGDEVALNPLAYIPEAQRAALKPHDSSDASKTSRSETSGKSTSSSESPSASSGAEESSDGSSSEVQTP